MATPKRSLEQADARAMKALAAVDEKPTTQLAMLAAIDDLLRACPKGGVVAREISRLRIERVAAVRAFHLSQVESAETKSALGGAKTALVRALRDAIFVLEEIGDDKDAGTLRSLHRKLDDAQRGSSGKPQPFFARYLEHQRR